MQDQDQRDRESRANFKSKRFYNIDDIEGFQEEQTLAEKHPITSRDKVGYKNPGNHCHSRYDIVEDHSEDCDLGDYGEIQQNGFTNVFPIKRQCKRCQRSFKSINKLHQHVRTCKPDT